MMKKLIRSTALILALVTIFMVPVSADDVTSPWVSFLNFDTGRPAGNTLTFTGSGTLSYDLSVSTYIRFVQGLVQSTVDGIDSITISYGSSSTEYDLNLLHIGNGLYRFYSASQTRMASSVTLHFYEASGSERYLELISFEFTSQRSSAFAETGSITVGSKTVTMSSTTNHAGLTWGVGNYGSFSATLSCSDWKMYDYLDFFFYGYATEVNSILGRFGSFSVPATVSYMNTSDYHDSRYSCMVRLDLTSLDRNKTDVPVVEVAGIFGSSEYESTITLLAVSGIICSDDIDPQLYYFRSLEAHLTSIFDTMAQRQDAYHEDLMDWTASYTTSLWNKLAAIENMINLGYTSMVNAVIDMSTAIQTKIDTLRTSVVNKLSTFQSSMETWFSTVSDKLDQLIGGTSEGDELSQGADDLEDQIGEIQDYEQSQQEILDNSFPEIQQSVAITGFTAALAFVQRYINLGWSGIGDFSIIYTLPIFIGLFFFICGRLPGATRWNYRPPKDGDSK